MTPSKLDEEAMRLVKEVRQIVPFLPGAPSNGGGYKDHVLELCAQVARLLAEKAALVEENERMRKGLEAVKFKVRPHIINADGNPRPCACCDPVREIARRILTPAPAVETKAKCGRCGGSGYALADREPTWMPCPDCATSDAKANEKEKA